MRRFLAGCRGPKAWIAERLGVARSTLWRWEREEGAVRGVGRRWGALTAEQEAEALRILEARSGAIGVEALRGSSARLLEAPVGALRRLVSAWKRGRRRLNRSRAARLEWRRVQSVWAADFTEAPVAGAGLLVVEDLSSGLVLAAEAVVGFTGAAASAVLAELIGRYGAPLVLKTDNGSGFVAAGFVELLRREGITHLRSPVRRPQYNGSVERTIGHLKERARIFAERGGREGAWSREDVAEAGKWLNEVSRPWGARGPSSRAVWELRQPSSVGEREAFRSKIAARRCEREGVAGSTMSATPSASEKARIERQIIEETLIETGLLVIHRGRQTLPIPA